MIAQYHLHLEFSFVETPSSRPSDVLENKGAIGLRLKVAFSKITTLCIQL